MNTKSKVSIITLVCAFAVLFAGCTTSGTATNPPTASVGSTAVKTLDATLTAVNTAEDAWAAWVAQREVAITKLPAIDQPAAQNALTNAIGAAHNADAAFRKAFEAALNGASAAINSGSAPATADVIAASTALLALLPTLQH